MNATLLPQLEVHESTQNASLIGPGPFIVGTDGSARADGAFRTALRLATRYGAAANVVSVLDPIPIVSPEVSIPVTPEFEAERRADLLRSVRDQMKRVSGDERTWPIELRRGPAPAEIVEKARTSASTLIVVGLGRHNVVDRLLGAETALQLLRSAHAPVLAVPENANGTVRRAVVAMDFSVTAIRAAQLARELLDEAGVLYLVHVVPRDLETSVWESMQEEYGRTVKLAFERVTPQLGIPSGTSLETVTLRGDPANQILEFAQRVGADLVAAGSHGYGFFSRLLLGSVATKLLRGATCTVLGVPLASVPLVGAEVPRKGERDSDRILRELAEVSESTA